MDLLAKLFDFICPKSKVEFNGKALDKVCSPSIEKACFAYIKSKIPGFTRVSIADGIPAVYCKPFPGHEEIAGRLFLRSNCGHVFVHGHVFEKIVAQTVSGPYECFIRSCLAFAQVDDLWMQLFYGTSVLLDIKEIHFMDKGETFEHLMVKFDLENVDWHLGF